MKILYVQHADGVGGSQTSLHAVLKDQIKRGNRIGLIVPSKAVSQFYKDLNIDIFICPTPYFKHYRGYSYSLWPRDLLKMTLFLVRSIRALFQFRKILAIFNPQLVHINSLVLPQFAISAKMFGYPVVWHVRERVAPGYFGLRKRILRLLLENTADRSIFISDSERQEFDGILANSIVVHNPIEMTETAAPDRKWDSSLRNLLYIGSADPIKGLPVVLKAFAHLPPFYRLTVVGCDFFDMGLSSEQNARVSFLGKCSGDTVQQRLLDNDVLICWPIQPHFLRPVIEAWQIGIPTIVSKTAAWNRFISEQTSWVGRSDSWEECRRLIISFADSRDILQSRILKASEIARQHFGSENFSRLNEIYNKIISSR